MSTINTHKIIKLIEEKRRKRIQKIIENLKLTALLPDKDKRKKETMVIAQDLRVKKNGIEYEVKEIQGDDCILVTPEGKEFLVDIDKLKEEYELA
jgi:ABC-type antimicrobial peptide transport system ATPase subunit